MKKNSINEKLTLEAGWAVLSQKNQLDDMEVQSLQLSETMKQIEEQGSKQDEQLDLIIAQLDMTEESELKESGTDIKNIDELSYKANKVELDVDYSDTIEIDLSLPTEKRWDSYINNIYSYSRLNGLSCSNDPFYALMSKRESEEFSNMIKKDYFERKVECDWIDYAFSTLSGVIAGLVDAFFVGMPGDSVLGNWTDKKAEEFIKKKSEKLWEKNKLLKEKIVEQGKKEGLNKTEINRRLAESGYISTFSRKFSGEDGQPDRPQKIEDWIKFLEEKYAVPYDETQFSKFSDYGGESRIKLDPRNHHLLSLAHSPGLLGVLFSIIDQFMPEKTTFVINGKVKRYTSIKINEDAKLRGETLQAKIYCGIVNWFNHCISDLAGSSGAKGRGSGLPNFGYNLFLLLDFGSISVKDTKMTIAQLACEVYQSSNEIINKTDKDGNTSKIKKESYDLRFGAAMAIPCVINEVLIRLFFAVRRYCIMKKTLKESIPFGRENQPDLRRMLLVSYGVLCVIDDIDAIVAWSATDGNIIVGAMHLNYYAQVRLALLSLSEIRAIYRRGNIDIKKLMEDVNNGWKKFESEQGQWKPYGLSEQLT